MSLKEKYLNDFEALRIIHNEPKSPANFVYNNIPLLSETYAFINSIILPALEKKINEYLSSSVSKKKFICKFDFTIYSNTSGKTYLLHDSDIKYFNESLQLFRFVSSTDTDLIYKYITHIASENSLTVEDFTFEGTKCLIISIQY